MKIDERVALSFEISARTTTIALEPDTIEQARQAARIAKQPSARDFLEQRTGLQQQGDLTSAPTLTPEQKAALTNI